jgi:hypothetical protein
MSHHVGALSLAVTLPLIRTTTTAERVGVVLGGAVVMVLTLVLVWRLYSRSFFNGVAVATGLLLSFDIVVFHWVFRLHRITEGSEANVIEPLLVAIGVGLIAYGARHEPTQTRKTPSERKAPTN